MKQEQETVTIEVTQNVVDICRSTTGTPQEGVDLLLAAMVTFVYNGIPIQQVSQLSASAMKLAIEFGGRDDLVEQLMASLAAKA